MAQIDKEKDSSTARRSLYDEHLASVKKSLAFLNTYTFERPNRINWGHVALIARIDSSFEDIVQLLEQEL
jgi:hypothetical protein